MSRQIVVTGTDTGVGKTIFSAALAASLGASYWKPIQSGLDDERGDSDTVRRLGVERIIPEAYRLRQPVSPHRAAELDGVMIEPDRIVPPRVDGPLVIEGAGGVLVPVTRSLLSADLFARWNARVVIVARTELGTINHSLLTVEALRARSAVIAGIAFVGDANEDNETTICTIGAMKRLGRLPILPALTRETLGKAFAENFNVADFIA